MTSPSGARGQGRRRPRRVRVAPGASPGQLVADPEALPPVMHVLAWSKDGFEDRPLKSPDELTELRARWPVVWVNVDGLGDAGLVARFGELLGLHRLALEDVLHPPQRPKLDRYPGHDFLIAAMTDPGPDGTLHNEQLAVFFGDNWVITFQERPGDSFDPVRRRIRDGAGKIRTSGPDYVVYALLDAVVDSYYPLLESVSDRLEGLEDEILQRPGPGVIGRIHEARRDLLVVRRAMWPTRELVTQLSREEGLCASDTRLYLRDAYDHTIELIDMIENLRDLASGLMEVYLSVASHRMNQVMTVLTVITTIFMPLSFIAGVYGMNFDTRAGRTNMPELHWRFGYLFALGLMAATTIAMLYFFRRRNWIGPNSVTFAIDPVRKAARWQGPHGHSPLAPPPAPATARAATTAVPAAAPAPTPPAPRPPPAS